MNKLFNNYQKELLKLSNTLEGRLLFEIPKEFDNKKIVKLAPNYFMVDTNKTRKVNGKWMMVVQTIARCYPLYAKKLSAALSCLEILNTFPAYKNLDKYQGLLNYAGLTSNNYFPNIMLTTNNYYSGNGDGYVIREKPEPIETWTQAHDAASGHTVDDTATVMTCGVFISAGTVIRIYRTFYPINTAGIADTETQIDAAALNIYVTAVNATDQIGVVQTTQASTSSLATSDYSLCGAATGATEGASRLLPTINQYNTYTLNGTGRTWVSTTGFTKLGTRTAPDLDNTEPAAAERYHSISSSEASGTSQDPYLSVTSVIPSGGAFLLMML